MKLSSVEKFYVNSFIRAHIHQPAVFKWLISHAELHSGGEILEIGCGRGHGLKLIQETLKPIDLIGLDFDPEQIQRAAEHTKTLDNNVQLRQGDAAALPFYETSFHAIFSFGALHHVPDWQRAVAEAARVLRPGGYFLIEEFYRPWLEAPLIKSCLNHPGERFTHAEFMLELQHEGLTIVQEKEIVRGGYGLIVTRKDV